MHIGLAEDYYTQLPSLTYQFDQARSARRAQSQSHLRLGRLGVVPTDLDLIGDHGRGATFAGGALVDKVGEHLDGVQGTAGGLGVELDTPDTLARLGCGDDALDGRVVAVDEEGGPA
jgi:hypothetical protein